MNLSKYCRACGIQIPEARIKALPSAVVCVNCAEGRVPKKLAVTTVNGTGDHTWNDIQIVEETHLNSTAEHRDVLDVEPEVNAPEEGRPIQIRKRKDVI